MPTNHKQDGLIFVVGAGFLLVFIFLLAALGYC